MRRTALRSEIRPLWRSDHSPQRRPKGQTRVIIADDHPVVREGLRRLLTAHGIAVVALAESGDQAIARARETQPDVALIDVRLPDMDGIEAAEAIREESPGTAILIISGYESSEDLARAIRIGAVGYLCKTTPPEALVEAVRLAKGGGSLIDPRLLASLLKQANGHRSEADAAGTGPLGLLSPRERDVLRLIVRGLSNKEIAREMNYSLGTVKNMVHRILEKLGAADRTQAAVYAVRAGLEPHRPAADRPLNGPRLLDWRT